VTPDPKHIRPFTNQAAFEAWLSKQHDKAPELWLKIYKKAAGVPTVTYLEALEVALCWGWIDGIKKSFDDAAFLQRFTPRKSKSIWSQINVEKVARLIEAGRMTEHGQKHVDAAKADGRWAAAYPSPSKLEVPPDLLAAIEKDRQALATFRGLNRANLYALAYRMHQVKPDKRAERIARFTSMLARGEAHHPNPPAGKASTKKASTKKATTKKATAKKATAKKATAKKASTKKATTKKATKRRAAT
jgi:uncharacterized protein YdeI (YjbR/CyaY-like superfamily)